MSRTKIQPSQINNQFWEEIGRASLASEADVITVQNLPARKYLMILIDCRVGSGGNINGMLRFNNDSAANYSRRVQADFGTAGTAVSDSSVSLGSSLNSSHIAEAKVFPNLEGRPKLVMAEFVSYNGSDATTLPLHRVQYAKWTGTAAISRVDYLNSDAGNFGVGTELVVLGHD